jgi:protein-S-isoprenylcysteine O-methyltransferase Ste14
MEHVEAIGSADITKIGVGVIIALVVIGVLLSMIITAVIGRVIILVVVIVLGIFVWQQRTSIKDNINAHKCDLSTTFFGIHLDAPDDVKRACNSATG